MDIIMFACPSEQKVHSLGSRVHAGTYDCPKTQNWSQPTQNVQNA